MKMSMWYLKSCHLKWNRCYQTQSNVNLIWNTCSQKQSNISWVITFHNHYLFALIRSLQIKVGKISAITPRKLRIHRRKRSRTSLHRGSCHGQRVRSGTICRRLYKLTQNPSSHIRRKSGTAEAHCENNVQSNQEIHENTWNASATMETLRLHARQVV